MAEEIRKLATQSNETAVKIQGVTQTVTSSVEVLAGQSEELLNFIGQDINEDYQSMLDVAQSDNDDAKTVQALVEEVSKTSEKLEFAISEILKTIEQVAEAATESTKKLTQAVGQFKI